MFVAKKALPRRTFLRAMGATVALPMLDAMVPALSAAPKPIAALRLRLHRQRRHPESVDSRHDRRRLRADAHAAAVRQRSRPDQRAQRALAPAGRHLRRRHRRSSAGVGGVAHRRPRLRPHGAGRRSPARHHGRSDDRQRGRAHVAAAVARAGGGFPDAGRVRFGRLLLRQHRVVAERDHAQSHRIASARRVRAPVRRRRQRRGAPGPPAQPGQHPRFAARRGEPRQRRPRRRRPGEAGRVSRVGARGGAAHPELRVAAARHRAAGAPARHPRALRRAHEADVRPPGAGVPRRRHARVQHDHVARAQHAAPSRTSACPNSTTRCRTTATIPT